MIKNYVAILAWTSVFLMVWVGFLFPVEIWRYIGAFIFFLIAANVASSNSKKE